MREGDSARQKVAEKQAESWDNRRKKSRIREGRKIESNI